MKIRPAKLADIRTLDKFQNQLAIYERPFSSTIKKKGKIKYQNVRQMILSKKVLLLVAEHEDNLIGCCFGEIRKNEYWSVYRKSGYVGMTFVEKGYRNKGVGKLLIDAVMKWLASKGIHDIRLKVYDKNVAAKKIYEKYGFKNHILEMIYWS